MIFLLGFPNPDPQGAEPISVLTEPQWHAEKFKEIFVIFLSLW